MVIPALCVVLHGFLNGAYWIYILFFFSSLLFGIWPHEFAHALIGRWLGLSAKEISIGRGKIVGSFQVLGFILRLRTNLFSGGFVEWHQITLPGARWRYFLMILAAPVANLCLGIIAYSCYSFSSHSASALLVFAISQFYLAGANLLPFEFQTATGLRRSDGYNLLELMFAKFPALIYAPTKFYYNFSDKKLVPHTSTFTKTG